MKKVINDHEVWTVYSTNYMKTSINTFNKAAEKRGICMNHNSCIPIHEKCIPELNTSDV